MGRGRNRREVLTAGASIAVGSTLAGCLGMEEAGEDLVDDTEEDAATDEEEEPSPETRAFDIDHLQVVTEEPTGYREYEIQDGSYPPDAVVWFYFEPVGVTTEDAGEGQERIELTASIEITDRNDDVVDTLDEEFHRDIPEGGTEELYLYFHFTPPTTPPQRGGHTANIVLDDELGDEHAEASITFGFDRPEETLDVEHVRFVEGEPAGYREYVEVSAPEYGPDEDIWIYFEPTGVSTETRDGEEWFDLRTSIEVSDPDGEGVGRFGEEIEQAIPDDTDITELYLYVDLDLRYRERPTLGEHTVELTVHDQIQRDQATATTTFRLEDDDWELLGIFEDVVLEETDVETERLSFRDDTVSFSYQSAASHDDEEFDGEIGAIAGAYAGVVDSGLSADSLRGTGTDADDVDFRYRIETEMADRWNEDEIDIDEYLESVFESLRIDEE